VHSVRLDARVQCSPYLLVDVSDVDSILSEFVTQRSSWAVCTNLCTASPSYKLAEYLNNVGNIVQRGTFLRSESILEHSCAASKLLLTMTNITSLTSGTLGKEILPLDLWPKGEMPGKYIKKYTNFSQTFSLTFKLDDIIKQYQKDDAKK
jgi:hypothetical protein